MKFSWSYVRKNPWLFGGIFVVFGLGLYLLLSRGSGGSNASSGGATVVSAGPSEAFQIQAMSIGAQQDQAQLAANVQAQQSAMELEALTRQIEGQENLAVLQMQLELEELAATRAITSEQTQASLAALQNQLSFGLAQTEANNQASVDMARLVQENATTQLAINAQLQRELSAQQLQAYGMGLDAQKDVALLSAIGTAKKKDRDTLIGAYIAKDAGYGFSGGKGDDFISFGGGGNSRLLPSGSTASYLPQQMV